MRSTDKRARGILPCIPLKCHPCTAFPADHEPGKDASCAAWLFFIFVLKKLLRRLLGFRINNGLVGSGEDEPFRLFSDNHAAAALWTL